MGSSDFVRAEPRCLSKYPLVGDGEARKKESRGGTAEASGGGFADNDSWPTGAKRLNEAMKDKACNKLDIAETRRKRGLRSGNTHTN